MKKYLFNLILLLFRNKTYKIRRSIAKGLLRKGGCGFIPQLKKTSKEKQFILKQNFKEKTVYDIGANIGIFSLFFARAVMPNGKLVAFEPNPVCFKQLNDNIKINNFKNTNIYQYAIGKANYKDKMFFDTTRQGSGSLNKNIKASIHKSIKSISMDTEVYSLDYLIKTKGFPAPDFIKIDVEGLEHDVLNGMLTIMKKFKPQLFIEFMAPL